MRTLSLRERKRTDLDLTDAEIAVLRERFGCTVERVAGRYRVTPGDKVGSWTGGGLHVVVRPKLAIARVLTMLDYTARGGPAGDELSGLAEHDLTSGVAALYARLCHRATRRGVLSGYREATDTLHTVRGRVDFAAQVRRAAPGLPLAVDYQEFDTDVPENRLLVAGLEVLRAAPVHVPEVRRDLHGLRLRLADVPPAAELSPIRWTRLNEHYRPAVELARLLVAHRSVDLRHGGTAAPAFVLDMGKVFEDFVRCAVRVSLGVAPEDFPDGEDGPQQTLDQAGKVVLKPDLGLVGGGGREFVGEVKYKRDTGAGKADDRYQLLAYAVATGLPEATLVYAWGPQDVVEHRVRGLDVTLHLRHLDLSVPEAELFARIDALAEHVRGCRRRAGARSRA
ncbi:McrC family protein [Actinokineospora sp. PR83]|uniref:McrC family protein n=1 Tax=Actinokineospora sp. PR83 TaxID=2884908 RepID=UPI0027E13879|nr:McrC family protein [Actinokineospora sp. PR83]MCG8918408.1 McrC family protein [Actinokineospora sp. PR83]